MNKLNKNIVFCGFMASGKTTMAHLLADKLNLTYIDTDEYICKKYNMTIPEIFNKGGEEFFRNLEFECIKEISTFQNLIISTGGGLLTFDRNFKILKDNSIIIFLDRHFKDIYETISKDKNRPLANNNSEEKLRTLYNSRKDKYLKFSHIHIINDKNINIILDDIIHKLKLT